MAPERKLYQKIKKNITSISWIRLENLSSSGTPDLLGYNNSGTFFTVELKVTKGNKVRFSPHQIAFHVKHPRNSFILVQHLGSGCLKLSPEDRKAYDGYQKAADDALIEEQNLPSIGNIDYSNKKSVMEAIAIQERGNVLRQQRKDFLEQAEAILKSVDDELPLQFGGPVSPLLYNF